VIQALSYDPARMGLPLHVLEPDGTIVRSFGAVEHLHVSRETDMNGFRAVAPVRDHPARVWSARRNAYTIEQWDTTGRHLLTIVRRPDWFEPWLEPRRSTHPEPPKPYLSEVWEDSLGRLWVWILVADPRWEAWRPGARVRTDEEQHDVILEIIDPVAGRLLASIRTPGPLHRMLTDGLSMTERQDESGYVFKDIWRVSIREPSRPRPY